MADLVTVEDFKQYKGIKSNDEDGKLQMLVTSISKLVENYCNRTFANTAHVEYFDSKTNEVILSNFPLISVTSVNISSDGGKTQTALVLDTDYFVDIQNDKVLTVDGSVFNSYYTIPYRSLEISYNAGYTTLPEDLKLAIFDIIDYYRKEKSLPTQALGGATIDNALPYLANSFPPQIRRVLDLYRYSA